MKPMGSRHPAQGNGFSPTPRVHFQVRIFTQPRYLDEVLLAQTNPLEFLALLGTAICPLLPAGENQGLDLLSRRPSPQRLPEVESLLGIETEIPHAIRGQTAAIA